jgi:hypothetical protein
VLCCSQESQLVFNGHVLNTECVRMVNEQMFVSCGEDGYVGLAREFLTMRDTHGNVQYLSS